MKNPLFTELQKKLFPDLSIAMYASHNDLTTLPLCYFFYLKYFP